MRAGFSNNFRTYRCVSMYQLLTQNRRWKYHLITDMSVRYKINVINWLDTRSIEVAAQYTIGEALATARILSPDAPDELRDELAEAYKRVYEYRTWNSLEFLETTVLYRRLHQDVEMDIDGYID